MRKHFQRHFGELNERVSTKKRKKNHEKLVFERNNNELIYAFNLNVNTFRQQEQQEQL